MGNINNRTIIISLIMIFVAIVYATKLFMLQVYDPSYKFSAESNARRKITEYPARGLIYDRNQKLLVSNQAVYDIMVVPNELGEKIDTAELAQSIGTDVEEVANLFKRMNQQLNNRKISSLQPSVF